MNIDTGCVSNHWMASVVQNLCVERLICGCDGTGGLDPAARSQDVVDVSPQITVAIASPRGGSVADTGGFSTVHDKRWTS